MKLRISIFLVALFVLMISYGSVYSTDSEVQTSGIIMKSVCTTIGGKIVNITIGVNQESTAELCEHYGDYFRLYVPETCYDAIGSWKDPKTGKQYTFPSTCDVPILSNAGGTAGLYNGSYGYIESSSIEVPISIENRNFDVIVESNGQILYNNLQFDKEQKKIEIVSKGAGSTNSITVIIPKELLSGEFIVLDEGEKTDFDLKETENASIITVGLDYRIGSDPLPWSERINIIGTRVIPEFSEIGMIIFTIALSCIFITRIKPKQLRTKNF